MPTVLFFNKLGARSTGYAPKKLGSRPDTQPSHALSRYVNGSGPQALWIGSQRARNLAWGMQLASDLHAQSTG